MGESKELQDLLDIARQHRHRLLVQLQTLGIHTPAHIHLEIQQVDKDIAQYCRQLGIEVDQTPSPTFQSEAVTPQPDVSKQVLVARKKSKVKGVNMEANSPASQEVVASDESTIERVQLQARGGAQQIVRAEEQSEISDGSLTSDNTSTES